MKKVFLLLSITIFGCYFYPIYGQSGNDGFHQHTGFYLSMSIGPVFGRINGEAISPDKYFFDFSGGTGAQFDFKIGGAIQENLILHAVIISNSTAGPKYSSSGEYVSMSDDISINEVMIIGGGLTYYLMPKNFFLSGSVGIGHFSLIDNKNNNLNITSDNGVSVQLKFGKEWWVSKNWGLGVALTYGKTSVNNRPSSGIEEKLNSNKLGVVFNATFN